MVFFGNWKDESNKSKILRAIGVRSLRLEFSGALYRITSRGDRREDIYDDDADSKAFLSVLDHVCDSYN